MDRYKYDPNDTIAAISTSLGESGIGIVRLSGPDALKIADKIFYSREAKAPSTFKTYTTHYGWIASSRKSGVTGRSLNMQQPKCPGQQEIIDEVILTVMRSPRSYTKEDVVEINCHGGIVAIRRVLDLVLSCGCRLAEPGEFTKRAFLNGRIDLAQAEAVLDIIRAKTESALKIGVEQLKGRLSKEISRVRKGLLSLLSLLEADIDFPEEEIDAPHSGEISRKLAEAQGVLKGILEESECGRVLREGVHTVICGRPNVGKSSLLNALLKQERSIVSAIAGTTRDTIEEIIDIRGIPIRIVDTAGILEPKDLLQKKAVQRSRRQIDLADLAIVLFDGSKKLNKEDYALIRKLDKKTSIAVINKIDLKQKIEREKISEKFTPVIEISAKKAQYINLLEDAIADLVYNGKAGAKDSIMVSNLRHIEMLRSAQKLMAQALNSLDNKLFSEFIAQDIREALLCLDDLLGRRFSEELLDKIFSEFCIGK